MIGLLALRSLHPESANDPTTSIRMDKNHFVDVFTALFPLSHFDIPGTNEWLRRYRSLIGSGFANFRRKIYSQEILQQHKGSSIRYAATSTCRRRQIAVDQASLSMSQNQTVTYSLFTKSILTTSSCTKSSGRKAGGETIMSIRANALRM